MRNPNEFRVVRCSACGVQRAVVNGRWLAWKRKKAGMTMRDVAARAKVSAPFVNDIEHCKRNATPAVERVYRKMKEAG